GGKAAPPVPVPAADDPAAKALKGKNDAILAFNAGVTAIQAKDTATAMTRFEEAARLDPKLPQAQTILADLYFDAGRKEEALAAADRYLALVPGNPRGLRVRYDILKAMGDTQRASAALTALAAADPGRDTAVRIFNEGAEASRAGKMDQALAGLNHAIEVDRTFGPAYAALADIYLKGKEYRKAVALADRWLEALPQNPEALDVRYQALTGLKDPHAKEAKVAMEAAKEAAKASQSPEVTFNQGVSLYNANKVAEATGLFERALEKDPNFGRAHYMLGLCYISANDTARAKEHLEAFLRLAPKDADAAAAQEMLKSLN
nr:tetratricopeptide repeat protein [Acidobacteriota bacterium]